MTNPAQRSPGALQGWTLVSTTFLSVIASAVIAPVLPAIAGQYKDNPNIGVMVSLVATLPALFVALLAAPSGLLADRVGHRKVLIAGVALYGFCGVAPFFLQSLNAIIVSRAGVGIMEAMIMVCANAMIGDYFSGETRERWLAYETGGASVVAVLMVALGGALGEKGWREPFLVYGFGFLLLPLVLAFTWAPAHDVAVKQHGEVLDDQARHFRWSKLVWICLITLFASTAFYVVIVQLSFILTQRGFTSPASIGIAAAIAALATPLGAVAFRLLRLPVAGKLTLSFFMSAVGFWILAASHSYNMTIVGAAINSFGSGIVLPALITWALATLPPALRGRGTGAWQTAMFFGQFVSPLIVLGLTRQLGSLSSAVMAYAVLCGIAFFVALGFFVAGRNSHGLEPATN